MKQIDPKESDALLVYHRYWNSYSDGDLEVFASTLDEGFEMIGTSESEICHSKSDGIEFFKSQMHEIVGRTEMRNRDIAVKSVNGMFLVNESCDVYILGDTNWTFYSKLRLSTLLNETESGWKVIQQHGSLPDMRVQEGETIAFDKISKENLELRDAVRRRTAELENKNRELAIEAALEKVRAVAMGMKKPKDMLDVCCMIAAQLEEFGVTKIRNVQTAIIDEQISQYLCYQYFPAYGQTTIEDTEYHKSPVENEMVRQMLASRDGHFTGSLSGKELEEFGLHRKEENHFPDPLLDAATEISYCFLSIGEGGLGLSLYQAMETEVLALFKRFHKVFSLAYQRFRDIQKAEAQAREAKIEVALEKVRSRTMGMQKSDELADVANVLFEEMNELVHNLWTCGFVLCEKDRQEDEWWLSLEDGFTRGFFLPNVNDYAHAHLYEGWLKKDDFRTAQLEGKKLQDHYDWLMEIPIAKTIFDDMEAAGMQRPEWQKLHAAYFSKGYLVIITREPCPEEAIFKRFAQVFDLTYTRFLDLQKAEAQAREAQIEVSLERVRARTMAMHSSQDVSAATATMFDELEKLGVENIRGGITIISPDQMQEVWSITNLAEGNTIRSIGIFDMRLHSYWRELYTGWSTNEQFQHYWLGGNDKEDYLRILNATPNYLSQPIEKIPDVHIQSYFFGEGAVWANSIKPHSEEDKQIMKRFASVFSLTFRRYRDLQKAEEQAREAQIEASLERVRSTSLAMHSSQDLSKVVYVVFTELVKLDAQLDRCLILTVNPETLGITWYLTGKEGLLSNNGFLVENNPHPSHQAYLEGWRTKRKKWHYLLEGEEKKSCDEYLFSQTELAQLPDFIKADMAAVESIHLTISSDDFGCLIASSISPLPEAHAGIVDRFTSVFNQTYTRFLDLQKAEAQAREAQIEAALERVRSRSMAMHNSQELKEVALELRKQMGLLGQKDLEVCAIHLYGYGEDSFESWSAMKAPGSEAEIVQTQAHFPKRGIRIVDELMHHYTIGTKDYVLVNEGEKMAEWFKVLKKHAPELHASILDSIGKGPSKQVKSNWAVADFSGGALVMVTYAEPDEVSRKLLRRSANVFEQAYVRFLDLQKAEAQAREAQIQLALERVRARTMSMQKSQELPEAANLLFQQIQSLGMPAWSAGYCTWKEAPPTEKEGKSAVTLWMSSEGVIQPPFFAPTTEDKLFIQMREGAEKGKDLHVVEMGGEELEQHYRYMRELPVVGEILDSIIEAGHPLPTFQIMHQAYFSKGFLLFITYEPVPESHEIFKRFAKVFDQTYTRFLDLQKSEAQAREAQIEAALERVRSRSLAMHKSEELEQVILVVSEQLQQLQFKFDNVSFGFDTEQMGLNFWLASPQLSKPFLIKVPYIDNPAFNRPLQTRNNGVDFNTDILSREENLQFLQHMFDYSDLRHIPTESKSFLLGTPGFARSQSLMKNTILTVGNYVPAPYSQEQNVIIKRFGNVFEQAYVRFLDLQKAEAQAREAQIEAALERVRSRTMAMFKSEELSDVAEVLFTQVSQLGGMPDRISICVVDEANQTYQVWATDQVGAQLKVKLVAKLNEKTTIRNLYADWKAGKKSSIIELQGVDLKNWIKYLRQELGMPISMDGSKGRRLHNVAYFSHGWLNLSSSEPVAGEVHDLLQRFASVFSLTYTRFLDLQKAEAQAREAQIEAALERVRSRSMAMHQSEELREVIQLMFEQFRLLNFTIDSAQFDPNYKETNDLNLWAAVPGQPYSILLHIPYADNALFNSMNEAKKRGLSFITQQLSFEEKNQFFRHFFKHIKDIPVERQKFIFDGPGMYRAVVFMENVSLAIQNYSNTPYTEEENDVLKRFGKTFEQVYTRFLDLQKAEAQAREAQIEAGLERVRSKTMAMHNSKDVGQSVATLFDELTVLGLLTARDRCGIGIMQPDEMMEVWTAEKSIEKTELTIGYLDMRPHALLRGVYQSWLDRKETYRYTIEGDDIKLYAEAIVNQPKYKVRRDYFSSLEKLEHTDFFFEEGCLYIFSIDLISNESAAVFSRFVKVFGQTYRRYLDLQKAENQAREAQIEAALEKVRSRSLAMQKPEELVEVAELLRGEMGRLGVEELETSSIYLVDPKFIQAECWYAIKDIRDGDKMLVSDEMTLLLPDTWVGREMWKFFQSKKEQTSIVMVGDNRKDWINYCADRSQVLQGYYGNEIPERTYHLVKFNGGYMGAASPGEISPASWDLLKRAAAVFSFAYTRFKDLQDAAYRAREAQIELAMEKVRGRTMAMQSSDELADAAYVLFEQLKSLGVTHERINIGIVNEENQTIDFWITEQGGDKLNTKFSGRISEPTTLSKAYSAWKQGEKSLVVDLQGDELKSWLNYLNNEIKIPFNQAFLHERRVQTTGFFSKGMLVVTSPEPLQEEALYLLEKFALVFDLTYTRFSDLKQAEAQARDAQVEVAMERIRARALAMQSSDELSEVAIVLREQMGILGNEDLEASVVHLYPEGSPTFDSWYAYRAGDQIINGGATFRLENSGLAKEFLKLYEDEVTEYTIEVKGEKLSEWLAEIARNAPKIAAYWGDLPPEKQFYHFSDFSGGALLMVSHQDPNEETRMLQKRCAAVFELAYKRFLDLQAKERQEKELLEEKKRLEIALIELKDTQSQLIQQEKLASLGQLTAGIAHEIKNPLNFVNNFSEVSIEMMEEALEEMEKREDRDETLIREILEDIRSNIKKVHEHGSRANGIVTSMLQHSRGGTGKKEPTDLNALIKEYVNLSFHGMRAGKNPINVDIILDLDPDIKEVSLIKEDFTRVIINLCNNAFDAMRTVTTLHAASLRVRTKKQGEKIAIEVEDNGPGIPDDIKDKILQPFFTTKKGTEGTGLGLSITHDIIKAHGGELEIETAVNIGTKFIIILSK